MTHSTVPGPLDVEVVADLHDAINPLRIRAALGRGTWGPPLQFGPGWALHRAGDTHSVIVTAATWSDGNDWIHASIAARDAMPTYDDLQLLYRAVWGVTGWAYQVFAPLEHHINIHRHALHLWGRADGAPVMPNFGALGTI